MLVLTRKVDDRIQIGPNITITVVRIKGGAVQIGIEAPGTVEILRGELAAAAEAPDSGGSPPEDEPSAAVDVSERQKVSKPPRSDASESVSPNRRTSRDACHRSRPSRTAHNTFRGGQDESGQRRQAASSMSGR